MCLQVNATLGLIYLIIKLKTSIVLIELTIFFCFLLGGNPIRAIKWNVSWLASIYFFDLDQSSIDAHGLKIQGRGYLRFCPGGSRLSGKTARDALFWVLLHFLSTSFFLIFQGSYVITPLPCVHLCSQVIKRPQLSTDVIRFSSGGAFISKFSRSKKNHFSHHTLLDRK